MPIRFHILHLAVGIGLLIPGSAAAQTPACALGVAENTLNVNNVRAQVFNTGSLFFGGSTTNGDGYYVPKAALRSPIFAAGLWVGGSVDGDMRVAAARYTNFNFWPGPLNADGTLPNPTDCSAYDRIYSVSRQDVNQYEGGGGPTADLRDWPVALGAEVIDGDGVPGNYNLAGGDRPRLYGQQTVFWVMNDVGNSHGPNGTAPIGLEVQVTAFARSDGGLALGNATFYRYRLIKKSPGTLTDARVGVFFDADLGNSLDDYVGSDPDRGLGFTYNADDEDEGSTGYGVPPAVGVDLLTGTGGHMYFVNGGDPTTTGDPQTATSYYNFLHGLWGDGTPMRTLGDGYNQPSSVQATTYAFPADPQTFAPWSEGNNGTSTPVNTPYDRRSVLISPGFSLSQGDSYDVVVAIPFMQGTNRFDSLTQLRAASDQIQGMYDDGTLLSSTTIPPPPPPPPPGATTLIAPADDVDLNATRPSTVQFSWAPVGSADGYRLQISPSPNFDTLLVERYASTTESGIRSLELPVHTGVWTYWRVFTINSGGVGPASEIRRFAYTIVPLVFTSFEVVANAAGLVVPPQPGAASFTGFPTPDLNGDGVPDSPVRGVQQSQSQNAWLFHTGGAFASYDDWLARTTRDGFNNAHIAGFDFEMRFTGTSRAAVTGVFGQTGADITVPFELWNIGRATPDDPSDDVRMIPLLYDGGDPSFGSTPDGAFGLLRNASSGFLDSPASSQTDDPYTDWIYWYLPVDTSPGTAGYDAFVAVRAANPNDGSQIGDEVFARTALVSWNGLSRANNPATALPEPGTVFRIWTSGASFVADEPNAGEPGALSLGVHPNPVRGRATVPFTLPTASSVRLSVVDVLGREVAVLSDGPQAAGSHEARLDAAGLASGVYVVVLRTDAERTVRRITVVR